LSYLRLKDSILKQDVDEAIEKRINELNKTIAKDKDIYNKSST
jgi:hypothetical protein